MSSIDLSHSVPQRMPIEAAAISFQICKITILMFCDTIDNMHSLLYPRGEDEQQQKKRQWSMAVCDVKATKFVHLCALRIALDIGHTSNNIKVIANVFRLLLPFSSSSDMRRTSSAIRQWINKTSTSAGYTGNALIPIENELRKMKERKTKAHTHTRKERQKMKQQDEINNNQKT